MLSTARITALVKGLPLLHLWVGSNGVQNVSSASSDVSFSAHLHTLHQRPSTSSEEPFDCLKLTLTLSEKHTFQHICYDNIGSAENDKCAILSAQLILAKIYDKIGLAEIYLFTIGSVGHQIIIYHLMQLADDIYIL